MSGGIPLDLLKRKALSYRKLFPYNFLFRLQNDYILKLKFLGSNFPHLIGLHKLIDKSIFARLADSNNNSVTGTTIFKDILRGKVSYGFLSSSNRFNLIKERFDYFNFDKLNDLLFKNVVIDFDTSSLTET